jgi:Methyltransferase domain
MIAGVTSFDQEIVRRAMQIPGQISELALAEICRLARQVPAGGTIVEVGSLFGRSSYVWATCAPRDVKVVCIDPWEREQWIIDWVEKPFGVTMPFSLDAFKHYTSECGNIVPIQGYSPDCVADWTQPIDLYFEDAVHEDPGFSRNVDFWVGHLKPGGVFAGDDFRGNYYDITRKVIDIGTEWKSRLTVIESLFWMRRPYL